MTLHGNLFMNMGMLYIIGIGRVKFEESSKKNGIFELKGDRMVRKIVFHIYPFWGLLPSIFLNFFFDITHFDLNTHFEVCKKAPLFCLAIRIEENRIFI